MPRVNEAERALERADEAVARFDIDAAVAHLSAAIRDPDPVVILEPKPRRGTSFALNGEITIGRDPGCTVQIDGDSFVSSRHARVFVVDGQAMVEDLGSTNGSFHNGIRLRGSRLLHPGDRVQVGYTVMEAQ